MGQQIQNSIYKEEDFREFQQRLRKETAILMQWFKEGTFENPDRCTIGLEIETWLVDQDWLPFPKNKEFLEVLSDPLVVPELSKYNAEINANPIEVNNGCFRTIHKDLGSLWKKIQKNAHRINGRMLTIGTLPTLTDNMLSLEYLTDMERYRALNEQVMRLRKNSPIELRIDGVETLESTHNDIMLEAATTSFQVHIQPPFAKMKDYFNAGVAVSFATVASSANSPYLFGRDLWDETRITLFEQAVQLPGYKNNDGSIERRVTFGHDYLRESPMEIFLDNLDGYCPLLPSIFDKDPNWLSHLRFHNGTIWRWNRPIIGINRHGQPHLRLEHRVMSSGPTMVDMVANMAFTVGLIHQIANDGKDVRGYLPFSQAKQNFYEAAQLGLAARVSWGKQKDVDLQSLICKDFLPRAIDGLKSLGVGNEEISYYLNDVFEARLLSGRTGASWQRSWIERHGRDFQGLLKDYYSLQEKDLPVHKWHV
jgi:hypothetical protein